MDGGGLTVAIWVVALEVEMAISYQEDVGGRRRGPVVVGIGQEGADGFRVEDAPVEERVKVLHSHRPDPQPLGGSPGQERLCGGEESAGGDQDVISPGIGMQKV